jgi:hypothetical protein
MEPRKKFITTFQDSTTAPYPELDASSPHLPTPITFHLWGEDGGIMVLQNIGILLCYYALSQPRRQKLEENYFPIKKNAGTFSVM